jgi:hypothetical protein
MRTPPRRSEWTTWAMALLAGITVTTGLPRAPAAQTNASAIAYAVQGSGDPCGEDFVPDDSQATALAEGPESASASREFTGTTCHGAATRARSVAEVSLRGLKLKNIITVESTGSADVYPFAKARAGLAANFFLRNDTDSVKTVNILITIGGTVENVARICDPDVGLGEPCFLSIFASNLILKGPDDDHIDTTIQVLRANELRRVYSQQVVAPGTIVFPLSHTLGTQVEVRGSIIFGSGLPLTAPRRPGPRSPGQPSPPGIALYFVLPDGVELEGEETSGLPGSAFAEAVLRPGQAAPTPEPSVAISPPSGTFLVTQGFDLALIVQSQGQEITSVTATLDGTDVSAALAACAGLPGSLTGGTSGLVLRCPGVSGAFLGAGSHTLDVTALLSGGAVINDTAVWEVLANAD